MKLSPSNTRAYEVLLTALRSDPTRRWSLSALVLELKASAHEVKVTRRLVARLIRKASLERAVITVWHLKEAHYRAV